MLVRTGRETFSGTAQDGDCGALVITTQVIETGNLDLWSCKESPPLYRRLQIQSYTIASVPTQSGDLGFGRESSSSTSTARK
ncbi:hypothetical protein JOB18_029957 [Solea senegalensis]|uniref:Uncharacterized protein n=1 Tax=Solea senegalensis TaxID=28829 RepID=A0AAV6SEW7_SOLSE|nr:hypothetical protein JOB18_029957 [Solea senegalensis]